MNKQDTLASSKTTGPLGFTLGGGEHKRSHLRIGTDSVPLQQGQSGGPWLVFDPMQLEERGSPALC